MNDKQLSLLENKLNEWAQNIVNKRFEKIKSFRVTIKKSKISLKETTYGYLFQDGYHDWMLNEKNRPIKSKKVRIVTQAEYEQILSKKAWYTIHRNALFLQITIYLPPNLNDLNYVHKEVKRCTIDAFKYISSPIQSQDDELLNDAVIGGTLHVRSIGDDNTKVIKRYKDFDPFIAYGIKKNEFRVEKEKRVKLTHKDTGIEYEIIDYTGKRSDGDLEYECFDIISEKVSIHKEKIKEEINKHNKSKMLVPIRYYNQVEIRI